MLLQTRQPAPTTPIQFADVALASALLLSLMLATLAVTGGFLLMSKPLWLDEYHTLLLAERQGVVESLRSLAQGADFNPPTLHLIYRAVDTLSGGLSPVTMRGVALSSVWLALTIVYATLRRHFSRPAAFAGAFAIWAHPLAITHAFEARFYGPWLLFTALMAWSAGLDASSPVSRRRNVALALTSILVCTIHYFGIFVWLVIAVSAIVGKRGLLDERREAWGRLAPMLSGPLALLLCTPFYVGQRHALSVATWVDPLSAMQLRDFVVYYFVWAGFLAPLCGWAFFHILSRRSYGLTRPVATVFRRPDVLALLALVAFPAILIVFSAVVQPSIVDRYGLPALLFWAPLIAFVIEDAPWTARAVVLVGHLVLGIVLTRVQVRYTQQVFSELYADAASIASLGPDASVVCRSRHRAYPLATYAGGGRPLGGNPCAILDFGEVTAQEVRSNSSGARAAVRHFTVAQQRARVHFRIYGFPRLLPVEELRRRDRFYVLDESDSDSFSQLWFPAFTVRRVAPRLFQLNRTGVAADTSSRSLLQGRSPVD